MSTPESSTNDDRLKQTSDYLKSLRVVKRTIVSAYILSSDDFLLMGRQDPARGGVFPNAWRIPGGGVRVDHNNHPLESLTEAMIREGNEEVTGLNLVAEMIKPLELAKTIGAEKTLQTGEVVWREMDLRHFEVGLDKPAAQYLFSPSSDLVELRWVDRAERETIELIPGGRELMHAGGYLGSLSS